MGIERVKVPLPEEVYLKETSGRRTLLDIGHISIAGFTDEEIPLRYRSLDPKATIWSTHYPLFLVNGLEAISNPKASRSELHWFYGLQPDQFSDEWNICANLHTIINIPADGSPPSTFTKSLASRVFIFDRHIPYNRSALEAKITELEET
jgi:hypothetical protein